MLYGHGDDIFAYDVAIQANFSSNVWHDGPHPDVYKTLAYAAQYIHQYPEPNAEPLRQSLAQLHSISSHHFMVCNGAVEGIYLINQTVRESDVSIFVPTFSEYEDAAEVNNNTCNFIPLTEVSPDLVIKAPLVFICNPNNPTGSILPLDTIKRLLTNNPDSLFVLDEAYADFIHLPQSAIELVDQFNNICIIRSLTKLFAIPGLRLGYVAAQPDLINKLLKHKMPWSVNAPALHTGQYIIQNYHELKPDVSELLEETTWLRNQINTLPGFKALPTETTFFLVQLQEGEVSQLKQFLVTNHGVLIRNAGNFRGLSGSYFRLSTQSRSRNLLLLKGLRSWIS